MEQKNAPPREAASMNWKLTGIAFAAAFAATGPPPAAAHHSLAMFDGQHPIELEGVVREFRFSAPHAFILLEVKQQDGPAESWSLESASPSALVRDGWSARTIRPGDQIKLTVLPLRSGAPGGSWSPDKVRFRDGRPIGAGP
jgi:hypothetical protein